MDFASLIETAEDAGLNIRTALADMIESCVTIEAAAELIRQYRTDNMGLGHIIYWSCIAWESADAD